jgi:hypothetical protein
MLNLINLIFKKKCIEPSEKSGGGGDSATTATSATTDEDTPIQMMPESVKKYTRQVVSSGSPSSISSISSSSSANSSTTHIQKAAVMTEITNRGSGHRKATNSNNSSFDNDTENETEVQAMVRPSNAVVAYTNQASYGHGEKKKYYLKGGGAIGGSEDELECHESKMVALNRKWPSNGDLSVQRLTNQIETAMTMPQQQQQQQLHQLSSSAIATTSMSSMPKSSLKIRKPGVSFDEKLEVFEVKNPHYGVEVKSEKRDMKRKKREKMREEDLIKETWSRMKIMVQEHNNVPYFVSLVLVSYI